MDNNTDDDYNWGLILPDFPNETNETKFKCCPEQQILDQFEGIWACVQHDSDVKDVINIFKDVSVNDLNNIEFKIDSLEPNLNSVCDFDRDISIWTPDSIDFSDNLARSNDHEEFFECLDVSRGIFNNTLRTVVASCIPKEGLLNKGCPKKSVRL